MGRFPTFESTKLIFVSPYLIFVLAVRCRSSLEQRDQVGLRGLWGKKCDFLLT